MKQLEEIPKKQTQVNTKLQTPEIDSKKVNYTFAQFLAFVKKQENLEVDKVSKSGNTKILLKKDNKTKIIWYAHEAKKFPIIIWDNLSKSTVHVSSESDLKKLIETVKQC